MKVPKWKGVRQRENNGACLGCVFGRENQSQRSETKCSNVQIGCYELLSCKRLAIE